MGMEDYSDVILCLISENVPSSEICLMKENRRRLMNTRGHISLAWTVLTPVKDMKKGFVFGYDDESCDVLFRGSELCSRQFSITFNLASGLLLLVNRSKSGTLVGGRKLLSVNQSVVLQHRDIINFGAYRFRVDIPNRGHEQKQFLDNQRRFLGQVLTFMPARVYCKYTTPGYTMKRVGPYLEVCRNRRGFSVLCTKDTGNLYTSKKVCDSAAWANMKQDIRFLRQLSHVR